MIVATLAYGFIAYIEWRYLHNRQRGRRAIRYVMGFLGALWILMTAIVAFRHRFSLGLAVADLFAPLERLLNIDL